MKIVRLAAVTVLSLFIGFVGLLSFVALSDAYNVCPDGNQCSDALSSGGLFAGLLLIGLLSLVLTVRFRRKPCRGA
jgi:hypothetical protein